MPRLKETKNELKNKMFRAEVAHQLEMLGYTRKHVAEIWQLSEPTALKKLKNPEFMTFREMRRLCEILHIPAETMARFI